MRLFSTRTNYRLLRSVHPFIKGMVALSGQNPNLVLSNRMDINWKLDLDEVIDFCIFLFGAFDKANIDSARNKTNNQFIILDIGANIGAFSLPLAQKLGNEGKIYAFEPSDYAFRKLHENIALNTNLAQNIFPIQCYLSDGTKNNGTTKDVYASWNMKTKEVRHQKHFGILTPSSQALTTTLDRIIEEIQPKKIDLIKIDADGGELAILKGGVNSIKKFKPILFIELCQYTAIENGFDIQDLIELLFSLNYEIYNLNDKKLEQSSEKILKMIPHNGIMNVVAQPV